jgi:hypothetical protein
MKFAGVFTRIIAPIMAALGRVMAYIRGGKSRTITEGFHVSRDGRVTYKSRGMRSYERKMYRWGRRNSMRTGGPVLTGARLLKARKSCCPANLTAQPRFLKGHNTCNCGMHTDSAPPLATYVTPDGEHVGMDLAALCDWTPQTA